MACVDSFIGMVFKPLKVTPEYVRYSGLRSEARGRDEVVKEDGRYLLIIYSESGSRLHSGLFEGSETNMRVTLACAAHALNEHLMDRHLPQRS